LKNIILGPAHPFRGGIANFGESLCIAFNKKSIDSSIITFTMQYPGFLFPGTTQFDNGKAPENIKIDRLINSVNPFSWISTANKIRNLKPDYLIINYWMPFMAPALGTIARRVQKGTDIKIIAITHNVIPHEKRLGDKQLTNYFVKSCDGYVTLAKSVLDDLKVFTSNPNSVFIPHPVYDIFGEKVSKYEAKKALCLDHKYKYILFFGIVRKYKGLDLLLEAFGQGNFKIEGIKLIVAGEFYEDESNYDTIIKKYALEEQIIFTKSFVASENVKNYFCASDLIVQPYRTATQSGVTQIAYHFERPMLVTNVGGLAEIVTHNKVGYVCEPNPEAIAFSINDFFTNNREEEFSKNTSSEKHRFSWEAMVDGITELYKKVY